LGSCRRLCGRWVGGSFGAVSGGRVIHGGLIEGGLYDSRHARVGVPESRAASQHVETSVPDGSVGRGAARHDGPYAPGRFFAVLGTAGDDCH